VRRRVAVSAMLFVGVVLLGVAIVIWSTVTLLAGSASGASGQRRREADRVAGERGARICVPERDPGSGVTKVWR
jgi:hypothetical protein